MYRTDNAGRHTKGELAQLSSVVAVNDPIVILADKGVHLFDELVIWCLMNRKT